MPRRAPRALSLSLSLALAGVAACGGATTAAPAANPPEASASAAQPSSSASSVAGPPVQTPAPLPAWSLVREGASLFVKYSCAACHPREGSPGVGPGLRHVYGAIVEVEGAPSVRADEAYLRESILEPTVKIVKGYQPVMPSFRGAVRDDEVDALVAFVVSLR